MSPIAPAAAPARAGAVVSTRNTNCGLATIASIAERTPYSKSRSCRPASKNAISRRNSRSLIGRRNACVAIRPMIRPPHSCSSPFTSGRQMKMCRRAGVSETPVTRPGPAMLRSFRCGSVVMP